tara:strand:- start:680 stop:1471 length:792 start_codon:yes stop_codon:yes gene_type:complete
MSDIHNRREHENENYIDKEKPSGREENGQREMLRQGHIYANEYPIMFPFGPPIYMDKITEPILRELDVLIEDLGGQVEYDASGQLAGRIKKQTTLTSSISMDVEECIVKHCMRFYQMVQESPTMSMPGTSALSMQLQSIWSNIQEAREYNPPHSHSGDFSFVIYTRNDLEKYSIEELQDNEYDKQKGNDEGHALQNQALAGLIELQYGEPSWMNWTQFRHVPSRGDIIIFPNWLRHTVYAHYKENHVRISVAGNVNILNVNTE